jgi:hypothetical protein
MMGKKHPEKRVIKKRHGPQQGKLRRNYPRCMHRKLCNYAQKTVHSNMLENQNIYDNKWLDSGMLVAIIGYVSFV